MPIFNLCRQEFTISVQDVEVMATTLQPLPVLKLTHIVEINGKIFPIRQLVAEVTGLSITAIIPLDAYKILGKLGYQIQYRI